MQYQSDAIFLEDVREEKEDYKSHHCDKAPSAKTPLAQMEPARIPLQGLPNRDNHPCKEIPVR